MDRLFSFFKRKLEETSTDFLRYKYNEIHWNSHALGLVGPRGVGKSTMLLQYIKQNLNASETLYISADQLYFATHTLLEVADQFSKMN
ncbi:MAG: AAA family ATPase, partial [Bacteroidales bacterium]|nr:AAA family ATPase [Bacteroidales bacterium]MCI6334849.1 AAA family ATPase [Bacteroidales bacterium]